MNSKPYFLVVALGVLAVVPVWADVMYQCVDADGHKTFSNVKSASRGARCTVMNLGVPV